jgi:predicted GIY-YIG superfamily endonuclease
MFWAYILENPDGQFHTGHTDNLSGRVTNHNRTDKLGGKFTRKKGPWVLVWSEQR